MDFPSPNPEGPKRGRGRPKGSRNSRNRRQIMEGAAVARVASSYSGEMLGTLIRAARGDRSITMIQVRAANDVLNRAYGRPPLQVQLNVRGVVEHKVYESDAEYRAALLEMGLHPLLLAGPVISDPPGDPPPLPPDPPDGRSDDPPTE
jgi:hypothetical protein